MDIASKEAIDPTATQFIDSVLYLAPRVAAFDCDGTLWSGDAGETFFDWEIKRAVVSTEVARAMRARYAEYKADAATVRAVLDRRDAGRRAGGWDPWLGTVLTCVTGR